MLARLLHLRPKTYGRLVRLSKEAERDGAYRVAKRVMSKNSIMLKTHGIGLPGPNGVKTTLSAISGRCNIVLRSVRADFPEQRVHPATIIEFKQIEFLDLTR